jgi:hypothetical protein
MLSDMHYALRTLLSNRLFAAMAIVSLVLGIGGNAAIYSLTDAISARTVPVQDPGPKWFLRAFLSALAIKSDTPYLHKNLKLLNAGSTAFGPARATSYRQ